MKGSLTQPVEGADSADNALVHEVVGNKTDTVAGDSLVSIAKQNLAAGTANLAVPLADAADNADVTDVVGNKTDTVAGNSLVSAARVAAAARLVPLADAADNVEIRDVVGNKADTIGGDSLYSNHLITQAAAIAIQADLVVIDAFHDVPAADSADNVVMSDVVGNKTDRETGNSIYSMMHTIEEHNHALQEIYPHHANPITLTADGLGGGWTDGAWVEIVPINTITDPFDIHAVFVSTPSGNASYEIDLAVVTTVAGSTSFVRDSPFLGSIELGMQDVIIPANSQVQARVRTGDDGGQTCDIKLRFHRY